MAIILEQIKDRFPEKRIYMGMLYKTYLWLGMVLAFVTCGLAQSPPPEAFSYITMVSDSNGAPVTNQVIGIRFSILQDSTTGTVVYSETQTATTDDQGVLSTQVGVGIITTGSLGSVDWAAGQHYLRVEVDPAGGSNYSVLSTPQLVSVPYAMYTGTANTILDDNDTSATNELQTIHLNDDTLFITNGGSVLLPPDTSTTITISDRYIVLTGDVTDSQADSIIQSKDSALVRYVWIMGAYRLTHVDISGFGQLNELIVKYNDALLTMTAPDLNTVYDKLEVTYNRQLTGLFLNALQLTYSNFKVEYCPEITSLQVPSWVESFGDISISYNVGLLNCNLPLLERTLSFSSFGNTELVQLSLPALNNSGEKFGIGNNDSLRVLSLPSLVSTKDLGINGYAGGELNSRITQVSFPVLVNVGRLWVQNVFADTLVFPQVTSLQFLSMDNCELNVISLPDIERVAAGITITRTQGNITISLPQITFLGGISTYQVSYLDTLILPMVDTIGGFNINSISLNGIEFPSLKYVYNSFDLGSSYSNRTLNFPQLEYIGNDFIAEHELYTLNIPMLTHIGGDVRLDFNHLNSTQVNQVLNILVNTTPTVTGKYINLQYQSPHAPPTGQGLIDKQTLINNGNTVSTD